MKKKELNTEPKILDAANSIFLLFGYHGTTLQKIANKAAVNKAAIHYYFRSKERLYVKVVNNVIDDILKTKNGLISNQKIIEQQRWFLYTEMYNNKILFESTLIELYANERNAIRNDIRVLLETKKEF
jgi:AcrR family transcriptional regulator